MYTLENTSTEEEDNKTNKQKHLKQNEQKIWTKTTSLKPSL